jgi:hypothetical protein
MHCGNDFALLWMATINGMILQDFFLMLGLAQALLS